MTNSVKEKSTTRDAHLILLGHSAFSPRDQVLSLAEIGRRSLRHSGSRPHIRRIHLASLLAVSPKMGVVPRPNCHNVSGMSCGEGAGSGGDDRGGQGASDA